MGNSKKTIKKSIFLSHISIIVISVILTSLIFNLCLNIYLKVQTRSQLLSAAKIIQKTMTTEFFSSSAIGGGLLKEEREALKSLLKINRVLKQTQTFLDINYALVGTNENLVSPKDIINEDEEFLRTQLIPSLIKKAAFNITRNKNRIVYFQVDDKKFAALIHPVTSENNRKLGSLILYSDLKNNKNLTFAINAILLSILLITSLIALTISNTVSKRISKPVTLLGKYAQDIGERNYTSGSIKYEDDEIGDLAKTMESMAEKLSAYDNTMKTFLQNASHELRTPLMSIQGYAEGIKYGVIDDKDNAVEIIIDESKRLTTIVEDLLYLSKLDSFQDSISLEDLNGEEMLMGCIERVNGIALQKKINISFYTQDKNLSLRADEEKLSRAIINILGNCLRYAKKEIKLTLNKVDTNLIITIEDDGPGFESNELSNIFERFFKGKSGKYGLGLAITRSIVEKHNGTVTAENSSNKGACFKINLPQ